MLPWITGLLALAVLALAAASAVLFSRARRARRELAEALHERSLALDRRCDALAAADRETAARLETLAARHDGLHRQVEELAEALRVERLLDVVAQAAERGALPEGGARRLREAVRELRNEVAAAGSPVAAAAIPPTGGEVTPEAATSAAGGPPGPVSAEAPAAAGAAPGGDGGAPR